MKSTRRGTTNRRYSLDLVALLVAAVAGTVVYAALPAGETVLRTVISLLAVFVGPGYALVSAVYPRAGRPEDDPALRSSRYERWFVQSPALTVVERLALAVAVGLVSLPIVAAGVLVATGGLDPTMVLAVLAAFTVVGTVIAFARRLSLPPSQRYGVSLRTLWAPVSGTGALDTTLNLALAVLVLASVAGLGYAALVPNESGGYSSFALLAEDEDGDLVAGNYPTEFQRGQSEPMTVRVVNQEGHDVEYTVVVMVERVETEDGETRVLQDRVHRRFEADLDHGESWTKPHEVSPSMTGEDVRVRYLLYRDDPGENPDPDDAYDDLYVWVDVAG
jgi:uncharacterized membrane protein